MYSACLVAGMHLQPKARGAAPGPMWSEDLYDRVYKPRPRGDTPAARRLRRKEVPGGSLTPLQRRRLDVLAGSLAVLVAFLLVRAFAGWLYTRMAVVFNDGTSDPNQFVTFGVFSFCFWSITSALCGAFAGWIYLREAQHK